MLIRNISLRSKLIMSSLILEVLLSLYHFLGHFRKDFAAWMGWERQLNDLLMIGIEM